MQLRLSGKLKTETSEQPSFASCRIEAQFIYDPLINLPVSSVSKPMPTKTELTETGKSEEPIGSNLETVRERIAASKRKSLTQVATSDAAGNFTLGIPEKLDLQATTVRISVFSPVGNVIANKELIGKELNARREESITLIVTKFDVLLEKPEPQQPPTRRIRGRVIERNGKPLFPCVQVLLLGSEKDAGNEDLNPILVTKTDSAGYFIGTIKNPQYKKVVARVAGARNEIEVRLVDGRVPLQIPLVVDLPDQPKNASANDCKCSNTSDVPRTPTQEELEEMCGVFSADLGTNQCIRFNVPNRAIEEFNFYSIVRTSDPLIEGITIDPHDKKVAIPTIPSAEGEGNPKGGGGAAPQPQSQLDPALQARIKARIETYLSGSSRALLRHDWANVERLIRDAVTSLGGTPLPSHFFEQFSLSGWGSGTVWGEIGKASPFGELPPYTIGSLARYAPVIAAASLAGATRVVAASISAMMIRNVAAPNLAAPKDSPLARLSPEAINEYKRSTWQPFRVPLDGNNQVDWDDAPTFYQAVSIAHGHLLHFKQVWYADGYSLGDLIHSLPLAPGQKKLISIIDWERREQSSREEFTTAEEGLSAALSRDRDLREVVTGTLSEASRGESYSKTEGFGFGKGSAGSGSYGGFNFGGVMGVSGGVGTSNLDAFQESSRNLASSSLQTLRDRTLQSASAVRSLRSTIVQTAAQGETVRATTEVVANHNHCHALTIQYFEVLRHFKVTNELTDVQECLFVPLPMNGFNRPKVLRWRESFLRYLKRPELGPAIDATERIETNWEKEYTPQARYADENVTAIFGELTLTIYIPLPPFPEKPKRGPQDTLEQIQAAEDEVRKKLLPTEGALGVLTTIFTGGANYLANATADAVAGAAKAATKGGQALAESLYNEPSAEERYARFQHEIMPGVTAGFVDKLELYALTGDTEKKLNGTDFTLVSEYRPGAPLLVSLRGRIQGTPRASIAALIIKSSVALPDGCRVIVNSAVLRYQTDRFRHALIDDQRVNDDIDLPIVAYTGDTSIGDTFASNPLVTLLSGFPTKSIKPQGMTPIRAGSGVTLYTPLDEWEQKAPRLEDIRLSAELITHLNENLEYYHHAIWWAMDPGRRYMLLDRYTAPNGAGRSVASVVDNTLIGIVGNSLILPVAPGIRLEPTFKLASNATLLEQYDPQSPAPPSRVSLPTRGVFAEAVMGDCNACEEIDDTRFWRWEESPIDEPPALDMAALASRRSEPNYGTPTPFPTPIVNIQNAPQAPDPTGVKAVLDVLGKESPFRDITGFAGTQANAAAAFSKAMDTALAFGKEASQLAQQASQQASMTKNIGQTMRAIDKAEGEDKIDKDKAKQLRTSALRTMAGDAPSDPKAASVADRLKVIDEQQTKGSISAEQAAQRRADVLKGLDLDDATKARESEAATEAIGRISEVSSVEIGETVMRVAGESVTPGLGATMAAKAAEEVVSLSVKFVDRAIESLATVPDLTLEAPGINSNQYCHALLNNYPNPDVYIKGGMGYVYVYLRRLGAGGVINYTDGFSARLEVSWEDVYLDAKKIKPTDERIAGALISAACKRNIGFVWSHYSAVGLNRASARASIKLKSANIVAKVVGGPRETVECEVQVEFGYTENSLINPETRGSSVVFNLPLITDPIAQSMHITVIEDPRTYNEKTFVITKTDFE